MTYSLKQVVLDAGDKDNIRKPRRTHYLTVAKGLTWQEAKARRNQNRTLQIVPERAG